MNIKERILEIESIQVGFDISLAEKKINIIDALLTEIENSLFINICESSREDIITVLQHCYGISYEIGHTKQSIKSNKDVEIAKRILPIARFIYGKSKELMPYLSLNLVNSISNIELHNLISSEISEIRNQDSK
jgi:hypothetical protein